MAIEHNGDGQRLARMEEQKQAGEVRLRAVTEEDLPTFYEQQADPAPHRLSGTRMREREDFMAHWQKIMAEDAVSMRTIEWAGRIAGNVVSFEREGVREVGYRLGPEFWGKGIATRALAAFVEQIRTRPLYGRVAKRHLASVRVLEKCGFVIVAEDVFTTDDGEEVEEYVLRLG